MMRTLYIVRHAKAEERNMFAADHDRQLTSEGIMAAARVGRYLHSRQVMPGHIISSTAPRAKDTARVVAEQLGFETSQIQLNPNLFDGGPKAYLEAINDLPDTIDSAMIVGHNPDVSYFAEFLTHQSIGSMSKGAVVAVSFEGLNWSEVSGRTGSVAFEIAPKKLPNS
ncbi:MULTISPECIES: SixA phosphatase family protein [Spirosoma]|uniref:Phosphohistidine phosphatase n=1 Tax=Spirosoma sordidisoli TaxID=2502893 RepID=A0A4Q2UBV0_9BACT|nr:MULTISPECIES: histidine phosphatase family protein [Spirosoma]RYC66437.1 phosphohistidine phosphatase [Spirosoma sordidisoli]